MNKKIIVRGARENNLKDVSLELPRDALIVFTGLSGSGKSSLAFDTIYAEGQRRYVESLSSYARQFLGQMDKPDVDAIEGLSPAISIDQKTTSNNPRSTVGTVTEIYDYLRLLYARVGIAHCHKCGKEIHPQSIDQIVQKIMDLGEGARLELMAPIVRGRKGEFVKQLEDIRKSGYARVRVDGITYELSEEIKLEKNKKHSIEVVIDRLIVRDNVHQRLNDSLETALGLSAGLVLVHIVGGEDILFSQNYACEECGISMEQLTPRMFSFNNPFGACPSCSGLGSLMKIDPELIVPNPALSLREGAIQASGWSVRENGQTTIAEMVFESLAKAYEFSMDTPFEKLTDAQQKVIFYGTGGKKLPVHAVGSDRTYQVAIEGVITSLERRYRETQSEGVKAEMEGYMSHSPCPDCKGRRLRKEALAVTVGDTGIADACEMSIDKSLDFFQNLHLPSAQGQISTPILKEIRERLLFLSNVGLSYLTLARAAGSLSGGEAQRIRLATQIGSSLSGVLYILDEPSIGLHQRDNRKLINTLKMLRDLGNTLIVVEHDEETMFAADYIVDVGPGAGVHGGEIVAEGTMDAILAQPKSLTGDYLAGRKCIPVPVVRRAPTGTLCIRGARVNNLRDIDIDIPLGVMTCITGVSGSGKSSLVHEIIYKHLAKVLNRAKTVPGIFRAMEGVNNLDKVIVIDQSPIGRTPRSNPATYTGLFDLIREVFAMTNEAKVRGYKNGRFSFNVKGGRCEACSGDGVKRIEMHFLPDIYVPCEVCKGKRYNRETLEVHFKGKSIHDVLEMTAEEALGFFEHLPRLAKKLEMLNEVGMGYIKLGHPSTMLSGGEAQRVKLATELARMGTGRTLYILDEPTTGLHVDDVARLVKILSKLTEAGNSVLVIEHNLDVIKTADHVIDLGPEGGSGGGQIVAAGTPEDIAACKESYTGAYLDLVLRGEKPIIE